MGRSLRLEDDLAMAKPTIIRCVIEDAYLQLDHPVSAETSFLNEAVSTVGPWGRSIPLILVER